MKDLSDYPDRLIKDLVNYYHNIGFITGTCKVIYDSKKNKKIPFNMPTNDQRKTTQ